MSLRLLLVTILTITITKAAAENVTSSTTITTPPSSSSSTIQMFTVPSSISLNSSQLTNNIIVEVPDEELVPRSSSSEELNNGERLTNFETINDSESNPDGENKIETNVPAGDAPKIILAPHEPITEPTELLPVISVDSVSEDSNSPMFMDYDDDEISGNSTISADFRPREASKSGEKAENPYFLASTTVLPAVNHDGYVLPTDIDDIKNVEIPVETNQNSTMPTPLTHWSRWMQTASRFVDEYPNFSVLVISVLFAMLLFLICLVIAECVKSRRHHHRSVPRHHIPKSVTADLYNTSNCSHFYTKPTILLNQQEVTMQLITSDITVDCSSETA